MKLVTLWIAVLAMASFSFGQSDENPGSLWSDRNKNPLTDRTARKAGDILTVVVSEISSSSFTATTSTSKKDATSIPAPSIPILEGLFKSLGYSANSSTNGSGSTTQAGNLTAKITVTVKSVMPNGNLVIEGTRWIKVNKDTQLVKLTGIVRPDDVAADNSIQSEKIAQAEIKTEGSGQIMDRQRQGLFTKLLSWLF